jgi:hypothetical protein
VKIGSSVSAFGKRYEVTGIRKHGFTCREVPSGKSENGCRYIIGERVKIIVDGELFDGRITQLNPVRAVVTEHGCLMRGYEFTGRRIRKANKE